MPNDNLKVLDSFAPDASKTRFPFPKLVTANSANGANVSEGPIINGHPMPGQWLLTEATRVFGWEERQGNYQTGATLVPKGDPLLHFKYSIKIFNDADAGSFRTFLGTLLKKPIIQVTGTNNGIITTNIGAAALGIDDPALKDIGITTVVVASVSALINPLVTSGGKGAWTSAVEFIEYRAPRPALPIPDQSIADPGAVTPSAYNMVTQENANMTAGAANLQNQAARQLLNH